MAGETKTAEQLAAEIRAAHEKSINDVKGIADEALGKAKAGEALTATLKEKADEALLKMNELTGQMADLEQKMARGGGQDDIQRKSLGQRFVEDENVKAWLESSPSSGKADLRVKANLTMLTTDADGSVGDGAAPTRLPGVQELPQRRMTVRDLLSSGRMEGTSIEYVQETGFNNNAAPVAEGAVKPSSDIKLDLKSSSAKVIAHWMKVSRQALDDVSFLRSMIDQRLIYGLAFAEENQLLNGDGTGQNLSGLITNATAYSAAFAPASATAIDTMRLAMLQAALAEYPATGHVMNPIDWARIELTKDADGRYIIGNPQGGISPTLWNLPVVATQAMGVDKFLTGAFRLGAQIFDRWDARVEAGYVNDDFTRNLVTLLGEERLALAVYRPEAFIYGDLGFVTE
ncbi:phage major capsid protein [Salipiger marinus]|uniref:Phage major capsid protein, HK97 family n=1 Tax=Salipiger marinus TaxID=555512 RepID=A0A1G8PUA9_9RHOB|nr:phage major capsid protein [Salipiger marinus]SDI95938.1 phage major capsid protein, HK97 family [Salipiger marinus]